MYCQNCGASISEYSKYCEVCGSIQNQKIVGYSSKINDPAFKKYIKNSNQWSAIFSIILAVAAIIGFFIYGETSSEMDNPQALFIGMGIGGMFIVIALIQIIRRNLSKTWDGTVVDKVINKKQRKHSTGDGNNDYYMVDYLEYMVIIKADSGKKHKIITEDDSTVYDYYKIGDKVRHHAGLNSYEKYDKSNDTYILCNACASLNDVSSEFCTRCKCPLLK